jgi:hypothetical protein
MSKRIVNFTWEEFWDIQAQYDDMMCKIEDRAFEIAKDYGKSYKMHQLTDIFFSHDNTNEYVVAEFCKDINDEEKFEYFKFNAKWLFSDDYKGIIDQEKVKAKLEAEKEYHEYLRLKAKFEGAESATAIDGISDSL